ncbi:unnamed protein product [Angiostrongylus costaricensis]|uniref:Uncharacterized protein n=1 Tax=Angiostrongylus costaricensis TaxID=334426 RepID=A0A158PEH3_ANGCS|nr:unnamed protein product [Angiostrongylus costaricensis]
MTVAIERCAYDDGDSEKTSLFRDDPFSLILYHQAVGLIYDNYDTTKRIENTVNSIYRITVALLVIVTLMVVGMIVFICVMGFKRYQNESNAATEHVPLKTFREQRQQQQQQQQQRRTESSASEVTEKLMRHQQARGYHSYINSGNLLRSKFESESTPYSGSRQFVHHRCSKSPPNSTNIAKFRQTSDFVLAFLLTTRIATHILALLAIASPQVLKAFVSDHTGICAVILANRVCHVDEQFPIRKETVFLINIMSSRTDIPLPRMNNKGYVYTDDQERILIRQEEDIGYKEDKGIGTLKKFYKIKTINKTEEIDGSPLIFVAVTYCSYWHVLKKLRKVKMINKTEDADGTSTVSIIVTHCRSELLGIGPPLLPRPLAAPLIGVNKAWRQIVCTENRTEETLNENTTMDGEMENCLKVSCIRNTRAKRCCRQPHILLWWTDEIPLGSRLQNPR